MDWSWLTELKHRLSQREKTHALWAVSCYSYHFTEKSMSYVVKLSLEWPSPCQWYLTLGLTIDKTYQLKV